MINKNKIKLIISAVIFIILFILLYFKDPWVIPSEKAATKRVKQFAYELDYNYKHPEKAYSYLTKDFRSQMSQEEFIKVFKKERSYPYLTPFFINYVSIEMDKDLKGGVATFSQAARLPGMIYKQPFIYENGNYYMIAYEDFLDGSYLDKFKELD